MIDQAGMSFFDATEDAFHGFLDDLLREMPENGCLPDPAKYTRRWLNIMARTALSIFDQLAPVSMQDAEKAESVVAGYGRLSATLSVGQSRASPSSANLNSLAGTKKEKRLPNGIRFKPSYWRRNQLVEKTAFGPRRQGRRARLKRCDCVLDALLEPERIT